MADTKNYGLKGVGDDVQFGKAGGRFVYSTGASDFKATDSGGSTLVHLQVLTPVGDTDAATKLYVDSTAQGLDFKESCRCATTATTGSYNSTGGAAANGQLTSVSAAIDGVTLVEGDRVLIKDHGTAAANGIYIVISPTTTLDRATDSNSDAEVTAGNFTFIEEGTVNADAGFVLQGPDPLTVGTGGGSNMNWVLFSTSSDIIAGDAITKSGNTLNLDFIGGGGLTAATAIVGADQIAFADVGSGNAMQLRTMTNVLADLDIVTAGANGMLVRTSADNYASRTLTASGVAGDEGISIVNGNGVSGNPTIGIDILGQTNLTTDDVDDADELLIYHSNAAGTEGLGNYAITATKLKTYMNAGISSTSITELNTTLAVSDSGIDGTLTFTADGTIVFTVTDTDFTTQNGLNLTIATGGTLTVADLTDNDVLIAGASGLVEDSGGALTFNGTTLDAPAITVDNLSFDGNTISSTAGVDLFITPLATQQLILDTLIVIDNGSMTGLTTLGFDSVSFTSVDTAGEFTDGDVTLMTSAAVNDRIESFGYSTTVGTVTSVSAGTLIDISGTGAAPIVDVDLSEAAEAVYAPATDYLLFLDGGITGTAAKESGADFATALAGSGITATSGVLSADTSGTVTSSGTPLNNEVAVFTGGTDIDSDSTFTWNGTTLAVTGAITVDELSFDGDTISNTTTDQPLILRPNGTGSIIFQNGSSEETLELLDVGSAINGLSITPGQTGTAGPQIGIGTGGETNVDIGFVTAGTGVLSVAGGGGTYEDNVTADDDIPNKKYVDDLVEATGGSGTLDSVTGTVNIATLGDQNIGAAGGIPVNAIIVSVTVEVDDISDTTSTVTVGNAVDGDAVYMATTENDPEVLGLYRADLRVVNGGTARQATATVINDSTASASAEVTITFIHA